ncbi:unnamed protein product [Cylicocyclus nassatus]|uniref:Uncharacterized protein n=1 Tax=Cylicocyclus nassatus TaxID=53992 RepID=A0AA36MCN2_CYLNA|nr:unnamed protein product [Cylicocyclus nassatus]
MFSSVHVVPLMAITARTQALKCYSGPEQIGLDSGLPQVPEQSFRVVIFAHFGSFKTTDGKIVLVVQKIMLPIVKLLMLMLLSQVMVEARDIGCIADFICSVHCRVKQKCKGGYCSEKLSCICEDCPKTAESR